MVLGTKLYYCTCQHKLPGIQFLALHGHVVRINLLSSARTLSQLGEDNKLFQYIHTVSTVGRYCKKMRNSTLN